MKRGEYATAGIDFTTIAGASPRVRHGYTRGKESLGETTDPSLVGKSKYKIQQRGMGIGQTAGEGGLVYSNTRFSYTIGEAPE